jgi:hypothetical protein
MNVISNDVLKQKRLKRIMGKDYENPALRLILERLEDVGLVEDMDEGRPVEWANLETERERKIAMTYFWKGSAFHREQALLWGDLV